MSEKTIQTKSRPTPPKVNNSNIIKKKSVIDYFEGLNFNPNAKDCKVYVNFKGISQDKLREAGYSIVRDHKNADVILIENYLKHFLRSNSNNKKDDAYLWYSERYRLEDTVKDIEDILDSNPNAVFVYPDDLYKSLYKYVGNLELYETIHDLLVSNTDSNSRIAMEMMANADWSNNEIYLQQLFFEHLSTINKCSYKTSISFKGFLESVPFDYKSVNLYSANNYRELCVTPEHHQWVFNRFKADFEEHLDNLLKTYKVKLDKMEYSIDESKIYDEED